jgi:transcriptional regulator with XRE-family HTH domain
LIDLSLHSVPSPDRRRPCRDSQRRLAGRCDSWSKSDRQQNLGDALGLTFQQVQKYEKGTNRIGASRLQHICQILQVPVAFFFEGMPSVPGAPQATGAPSPAYVTDFLATSDGLRLTKAFMRIENARLRCRIVDLVQEIAPRG